MPDVDEFSPIALRRFVRSRILALAQRLQREAAGDGRPLASS